MTKSLEEALNLPPAIIDDTPVDDVPENELESVEENLINARDIAKEAVDEIRSIAKQSQHPQAYQVLNTMVKTYADISMAQLDYKIKKKRLERESGEKSGDTSGQVVNQNLFVGSTAELMQMLEQMKKDAEQQ